MCPVRDIHISIFISIKSMIKCLNCIFSESSEKKKKKKSSDFEKTLSIPKSPNNGERKRHNTCCQKIGFFWTRNKKRAKKGNTSGQRTLGKLPSLSFLTFIQQGYMFFLWAATINFSVCFQCKALRFQKREKKHFVFPQVTPQKVETHHF